MPSISFPIAKVTIQSSPIFTQTIDANAGIDVASPYLVNITSNSGTLAGKSNIPVYSTLGEGYY